MARDPGVFPIQGEDFVGQNLEHPRPKAGVLVIAVEGGEGAHHGVLDGVGRVPRLPHEATAIRFQIALDRLEQR